MITRIEISGFKTFTDFAVDLAPFTVIAGANASGKSNFMDVLRLLHSLTKRMPVLSWFSDDQRLRDPFTKYSADEQSSSIELAVEFLLPPIINDRRKLIPIEYIRLRYEVVLGTRDDEDQVSFIVKEERLQPIVTATDQWLTNYMSEHERKSLKLDPILPEHTIPNLDIVEVDGKKFRTVDADERLTRLSQASGLNRHLFAIKKELEALLLLELNRPDNFSNYDGYKEVVPSKVLLELMRAKRSDKLQLVTERVRRIIKEIKEVDVYVDELERGTVRVRDNLDRVFYTSNVSEGTLRVLSLATMLIGSNLNRTLYLEEPENGVDPRVIGELFDLLLDLTTDLSNNRLDLRQVICTTHSPTLLQEALNRQKDRNAIRVLLTTKVTLITTINGKRRKLPTTRMNEVVTSASEDNTAEPLTRYTLRQALDYLNRLQLPDDLLKALPDA